MLVIENGVKQMTMTIAAAIAATDINARAYNKAMNAARDVDWFSSPDCNALREACSITVGRVTVSAGVGGNTLASHVRHTFEIDGKRASASAVEALVSLALRV